MHRALKRVVPLIVVGVSLLPGVAGAQSEQPKQCPPPTIYSSWADDDDVYTVKLANHLTPLGLSCQHGSAGLVMSAEQTVLASVVVPLYYILPGGVGQGPPAEVVLPRPDFPCGTHQVRIDLVPADVAAGLALGQPVSGGSWAHKLEAVNSGVCPTTVPPTTQPALRASASTAGTVPTTAIAVTTTTAALQPAAELAVAAQVAAPVVAPVPTTPAVVAPVSTTPAMPSTSAPPATVEVAVENTTTTISGARALSLTATIPATSTIPLASGSVSRAGVNRVGLAVSLGAILAVLGAGLIGWRRRAAP